MGKKIECSEKWPERTERDLIHISAIDLEDKRFWLRDEIDGAAVASYEKVIRKDMRLGRFPLPKVWECHEGRYLIVDGWHRILAAINAGIKECEVEAILGDERYATLAAARANRTHGMQLKYKARVRSILCAIEAIEKIERVPPSTPRIAADLNESESFVRRIRGEPEESENSGATSVRKGSKEKAQPAKKECAIELTYEAAVLSEACEILLGHDPKTWRSCTNCEALEKTVNAIAIAAKSTIEEAFKTA